MTLPHRARPRAFHGFRGNVTLFEDLQGGHGFFAEKLFTAAFIGQRR
ncbi:Uncharacterised protein [Vibrio cholerae]|nr:Uncharacterised protein [Vibrio cholerae]CSC18337.1 Uncharacterised protein [Vibrio cholerae]